MKYDDFDHADWYRAYRKQVMDWIFQGQKQNVTDFYEKMTPNVTWFTQEKYDYYVVNKTSATHKGFSNFLISFVAIEGKMSQYVAYQTQMAINDLKANYSDDFNLTDWKFGFADDRFDEPLIMTFGKRLHPHLWVFDKETNRSYSWDRPIKHYNASNIRDWILHKQYRNSSLQFDTPLSLEYEDIVGMRWFNWANE